MNLQSQCRWSVCGLNHTLRGKLSLAKRQGFQDAGAIRNTPFDHFYGIDRLSSLRFIIEKQLGRIAICVSYHTNWGAFFARPVPVRKNVNEGLAGEERLVQKVRIFWKSAGIEYA